MTTIKMPKLKIHYSLIVYFIICLYAGFLKDFLIIFSILIFHELGHMFWIYFWNGKVTKLSLSMIGGLMEVRLPKLKLLPNCLIICGRPN